MVNSHLSSDIDEIVDRLGATANKLSGKVVLLTGARGFLGRYITNVFQVLNTRVLKSPVTLIGLDNLITSGIEGATIPEVTNTQFIKHNVIDKFNIDGGVDYVIHAAGIASPYYYRAYPIETLEVAIKGTQNMLELANEKGACFTFFSSSEIYGDPEPDKVPMSESYRGNVSCQGPRACYDESKRVGETLCYIYNTKDKLHTNVIRPFNVYGPGMQESDYRVLPNFASKLKAGEAFNIYGEGFQTRTFCYVTDAILGFLLVILKGASGEAYNIGNPEPEVSILELAECIEKVLDKSIEVNLVEYPQSYPADEPMRRSPDISKARKNLGYTPTVELEDGIYRFFSWSDKSYSGKNT
ncbi:MAG: NAD-dependent epimerase/dehydratase family protein [Pseudomonadota bacterium]|nr:NAD-dependent epimerase/dehydratase family protein [Pseudomonadota bacterium]